ncbi:MAG: hypothetical protein K8S00_02875 [Bacteroidales bacterium]|nr:hypothetical protein [Bacteroidales bacterium]
MKKLSLLISLMAFIFIASVSSSYAQTTSDDKKAATEKTTITTSKAEPADKAQCPKTSNKAHKCSHKKPGHKCPGAKAAKPTDAQKASGVREQDDAIIEEKDKAK